MPECTKCLEHLPREAFYRDVSKPDGITYDCRECRKKHQRDKYADDAEYKDYHLHKSRVRYLPGGDRYKG